MSGGVKPLTEDSADEKLMHKAEVVALLADVFADDKEVLTIVMLRAKGFQVFEIRTTLSMNSTKHEVITKRIRHKIS